MRTARARAASHRCRARSRRNATLSRARDHGSEISRRRRSADRAERLARPTPQPVKAFAMSVGTPYTYTSHGGRATSSQQPPQLRRSVDVQAFNAQPVRGHDDDRRRAGRPHRWPGDLHLVKPRALLRRTRPAIEAPRRHTERRGDTTPSVALSLPLPTVLNRLLLECSEGPRVARCRGRDSPAQRPSGTERLPDPSASPREWNCGPLAREVTRRRREALMESVRSPHPETAHSLTPDWRIGLPNSLMTKGSWIRQAALPFAGSRERAGSGNLRDARHGCSGQLDPTAGHQQRGVRPGVAVSDPDVNADQRFPLIALCPSLEPPVLARSTGPG